MAALAKLKNPSLLDKQQMFVRLISKLIAFAYENGYELTFGESYDDDGIGHMRGSLHYVRLAADLNLFKNDVWLKTSEAHRPLGEFWESLGTPEYKTAWGGRWGDGNHYSIEHNGKK